MEPTFYLEIVRLILSMAIIPALLWAWQTKKDIYDLKIGQENIKDSNTKEHTLVISELKELNQRIGDLEKHNQKEHSAFNERLHKLDTENRVEHVLLGLRKDNNEDCTNH